MARPLKIEYEGAFYLITARGNEKGKIFFSKTEKGQERKKDVEGVVSILSQAKT